ncbi:MAG: MBL fold metallo-hydrolase [Bacteroidota bacterium]
MLTIQKWTLNPFQENTYGIHDGQGNAVIIDPGMYHSTEKEMVRDWFEEHGRETKQVWLTHAHLDHVFGCDFLFSSFGTRPILDERDVPTLENNERASMMYGIPMDPCPKPELLNWENALSIGDLQPHIIFTPGHSPGHVAFYFKEQGAMFSGDVLFQQSIGRTDLPGGGADTLRDSIQKIYSEVPSDVVIYSGHGPETTVGQEAQSNPFVNQLGSGLLQRE